MPPKKGKNKSTKPKGMTVNALKKLFQSPSLSMFHQECRLAGAKVFVLVAPQTGTAPPQSDTQGYRLQDVKEDLDTIDKDRTPSCDHYHLTDESKGSIQIKK